MKRASYLAIPLILASGAAAAGQSGGNAALALAAIVGQESPALPQSEKTVLAHLLNSETNVVLAAGVRHITVKADKIVCRMGDVDLTLHSCVLSFGKTTVTKSGEAGQTLLATMRQNDVPSDGAAGTIYYTAVSLVCTVDVVEVESRDGGGAKCSFKVP